MGEARAPEKMWVAGRGFLSGLQHNRLPVGAKTQEARKKLHKRSTRSNLTTSQMARKVLFPPSQVGKVIVSGELEYPEGYCLNNWEEFIPGQNTAWAFRHKASK